MRTYIYIYVYINIYITGIHPPPPSILRTCSGAIFPSYT